jgi:Methyltransferase domain
MRHNQRRQEHLASLGLDLAHRSVLEVGAGIGDHTSFFLDRGCTVVVTEAQEQNLSILRSRHPELDVRRLDLDNPGDIEIEAVSVVYCYGTLYHLESPTAAIAWMARRTQRLLLVETCVAPGDDEQIFMIEEAVGIADHALRGHGCRPTRSWVRRELERWFPYVYFPVTQPWHAEFPLDWSDPDLAERSLIRAIFVASRQQLNNPVLTASTPSRQVRH